MAKFTFIKADFLPPGTRVDVDDYYQTMNFQSLLTIQDQSAATPAALTLTSPLPPAARMAAAQQSAPAPSNGPSQNQLFSALADAMNFLRIKLPLPRIVSAIGRVIQGEGFMLSIPETHPATIEEQAELVGSANNEREATISGDNDDENQGQRTFCPPPSLMRIYQQRHTPQKENGDTLSQNR
jgi:hypothetical protein